MKGKWITVLIILNFLIKNRSRKVQSVLSHNNFFENIEIKIEVKIDFEER